MNRSTVIAGVVLFTIIGTVAGGLWWWRVHKSQQDAAKQGFGEIPEFVQIVEARERNWQPTADLVGTVFSLRSVRLSNELAGRVREVKFDSGTLVEPGTVLMTLDDSTDRADLDAAQASVRVAEANVGVSDSRVALAKTEIRRLETAVAAAAAPAVDLDRAKSELQRLEADRQRTLAEVDQARARAAQVQTRIDKLSIKAPFRGRVGIRTVHDGQYLAEGSAVVMLEEIADKIYLDFPVPQEYLPRVKVGMVVNGQAAALGQEPLRLEVVAIDATVNNDTRNVRVRAVVDNRDGLLRPGMFVQIRVPVEAAKPYVVIPTTAVRRTSYADQIFVVVKGSIKGSDGKQAEELRAQQRFVKLGPTLGDDVVVLEGLKAGEQVASTGSFKLRDKALVMAAPPPAPPSPAGASTEKAAAETKP